MWRAIGDSTVSSKAWVVESDYVSLDAASGGAPFSSPRIHRPNSAASSAVTLAAALPAEGWRETHEKYRFALNSFGWGDPSFAAYYPACRGVLGFHDTISTDELAKGDLLTYLVVGWYSDPEMDPLRQQNGDDLLASLRWSCASLDGATVPQRTLCHGAVVNLQWRGTDEQYPSASSGSKPPTIAIGGSGAEALAALLAPDDPSLQQAPSAPSSTDRRRKSPNWISSVTCCTVTASVRYQVASCGQSSRMPPLLRRLTSCRLARIRRLNQCQQKFRVCLAS